MTASAAVPVATAQAPVGRPTGRTAPWRDRELLVLGLLVALLALLWIGWVTAPLFVFTEARVFALVPHPIDPLQFFLFPEPAFGEGRLAGIVTWDLTGAICGVDAACTNANTAVLVALAAIVVFLHSTQLCRSPRVGALIAALWMISGPVLVTAFWQSARFDILVTVAMLVTTGFWWHLFGRARLTPAHALGAIVASCLLMAVAFNTKEVAYLLVPILPLLAIVRGWRTGAVRGNLVVATIPFLYGTFFVLFALGNASAAYMSVTGGGGIAQGVGKLLGAMTGTSQAFAFVWQRGPDWSGRHQWLLLALVSLAVLFAIGVLGYVVKGVRRGAVGRQLRLLKRWDRELYLAAMLAGTLVIGGRSTGAAGHYALVSHWAALTIGALLLVRIARLGRRWRTLALVTAVDAVIVAVLAIATLIAPGSTYQQLVTASSALRATGAGIQEAVGDRPISTIHWRTLTTPPTSFFLLRGKGLAADTVDWDLWPWLTGDIAARPDVESIAEGDLDTIRADVAAYAGPGSLLVAIDEAYRLRLVAYDGTILLDTGDDPPA